jgi:hypothetical protein
MPTIGTVEQSQLLPQLFFGSILTGSAGKKISDTLVSFFGGLSSLTSDDGVLDEYGSVTVEFDHDDSSFKKAVDEIKVEDASNFEDELAGGKQKTKNNNKKMVVVDTSTSSDA